MLFNQHGRQRDENSHPGQRKGHPRSAQPLKQKDYERHVGYMETGETVKPLVNRVEPRQKMRRRPTRQVWMHHLKWKSDEARIAESKLE